MGNQQCNCGRREKEVIVDFEPLQEQVSHDGEWGRIIAASLGETFGIVKGGHKRRQDMAKNMLVRTRSSLQRFEAENRAAYSAVWDRYDANHNGILERDECRKMTKDALEETKKHVPALLRALTKDILDLEVAEIKDLTQDPDVIKEMTARVNESIKTNIANLEKQIDDMILNHEKIADHAWKKMDLNNDGKVEKSEFLATYHSRVLKLLDPDSLYEFVKQLDAVEPPTDVE